jgi:apoptosis-inducing factor 3
MELDLTTAAVGLGVAAAGVALYVALRPGQSPTGVFTGLTVDAIPPGTMREAKLDDSRTVLLAHVVGQGIKATGSKCTHSGASLVTGVLVGSRIVCPWHAACFDACTGDIEDGPVRDALPSFPVQVTSDGRIFVTVPERIARGVVPRMSALNPADARHFVIIGAGAAGASAAEQLRHSGFTGRITMLSAEPVVPYDRPKLSSE